MHKFIVHTEKADHHVWANSAESAARKVWLDSLVRERVIYVERV